MCIHSKLVIHGKKNRFSTNFFFRPTFSIKLRPINVPTFFGFVLFGIRVSVFHLIKKESYFKSHLTLV